MGFWERDYRAYSVMWRILVGRPIVRGTGKKILLEKWNCNAFFLIRAYLLMGVTGLGYLALTWSTVVLLGGFVSTIGWKDFWCLTIISMIQAVRIFNDLEENLFNDFRTVHLFAARNARKHGLVGVCKKVVVVTAVIILGSIYRSGPVICLVLSLWRIVQRDYGTKLGDDNLGNLLPALVLFYSMVLCQFVLFILWLLINWQEKHIYSDLLGRFKLTQGWGKRGARAYFSDTRERCWRNPASIRGRSFMNYGVDMLDSDLPDDYLLGVRMMNHFIGLEIDVSWLILPSRPRVQRLMDALGLRNTKTTEIKKLSARIVAKLTRNIHLSQFPGAMQSISSLLDITAIYWSKKNMEVDYSFEVIKGNELILQGLTILERLACNQNNCRDICSNPDLLHKIMAPIYSDTLMQDICIEQWLSIVNGSFRVVRQLMQADEWTGSWMRREISSRALSNLKKILDNSKVAGRELYMAAMCIMTELALDASTNLSHEAKEFLVYKQVQILFADEINGITSELKVSAGKSIATLSNNENISAYIIRQYSDIVACLTEMLDSRNKIVYRTIAAEILKNLFCHCSSIRMKDTLLVQVLSEVPTSKRKPRAPGNNEEIIEIGPDKHDENNQLPEHKDQTELSDEARLEQLKFQAAYLSLALMLCNKLMGVLPFQAAYCIRDEAQIIIPEEGEFAANLKAIIEENCRATLLSVRIVKLSLQIAISVMQRHSQYAEHFKDQKFKLLLSTAMKIMPSLESCLLFGGTDCRGDMAARPLLKDLVAEVLRLVSCPP